MPPEVAAKPLSDLDPPKGLTGKARSKWNEIVQELRDAGILGKFDRDVLATYCEVYQEAQLWKKRKDKASRVKLKPNASASATAANDLAVRSAFKGWDRCTSKLTQLANTLGMTPISRGRVEAIPTLDRGSDEWDDLDNPRKQRA